MQAPWIATIVIAVLTGASQSQGQDKGLLGWVIGLSVALLFALILTNREDPTARS